MGYIKIPSCSTQEQSAGFASNIWARLNMDPKDQSTWTKERIHMPTHQSVLVADFAPKAWNAICDLLGGTSRINTAASSNWRDSFIVNLGTPSTLNKPATPRQLYDWHIDGDFFIHYLDSPEQALLVIPLFSGIAPNGGGTFICPPAISTAAQHLYENPAGVSPRMVQRPKSPADGDTWIFTLSDWFNPAVRSFPPSAFVEVTGQIGDVYLLHPLMLHSASKNATRVPRIITNPPVSLREPFCFDRREEDEFSLVERKTLKALGRERLEGWQIRGSRERIVPERTNILERMRKEEAERLGN
ncbi:uncharacterized protein BDZ99DRAFT_506167 [Mytilinidion resinicola]|uniref:Clavaminate synthase-like protein n=1 Tax=Mytilinidion resinicola TaxID=574789 RepID=A0A6A6Z1W8_9PEZI|nr:uncharacterized protein BDZ99DRAFT_506167 [Mytilinidion resinicola]KAF2814798.1 hypothetical protein BDZ99DRAFT_506167 [Mytilinidion resinicola]